MNNENKTNDVTEPNMNKRFNWIFGNKELKIYVDGENNVLFEADNVGEVLGLSEIRSVIRNYSEKHVIILSNSKVHSMHIRKITQSTSETPEKLPNRGKKFLTEAGLYKVVFNSRKEEAEQFQDWICCEVLPSLRKNNYYIDKENINQEQLDNLQKELQEVKDKYLMYRNEDYYNIFDMREMLNYTSNEFPCYTDKLRSKSIEMGFPIKQEEIYCYGSYNYYNRYHFMVWEEVYKNIKFVNEDKEEVRKTYEKLIS